MKMKTKHAFVTGPNGTFLYYVENGIIKIIRIK